ncbi:uncharacterized protein F5891DRAFT_484230 [Suillus fuscotomentosus]|uniref:Uncharacterized protein n=1 Tax=Suillus fuscotomentosus TaxID=1912939 RepID=A0AAD4DMX7_9AGAM|nr:uncharacterized protein F5891DRAFT_484230 [Suillus fuscotomentosus]KAG1884509.1 hypothetical protein F5891DRAFT_484230 [Suillus fuscotomentosus]
MLTVISEQLGCLTRIPLRSPRKLNDLNDAISFYEESLHLCPIEDESRDSSLDNLGSALVARFTKRRNVVDLTRAITLHREALSLRLAGHPLRDNALNHLALALQQEHGISHASEDLNETINLYH